MIKEWFVFEQPAQFTFRFLDQNYTDSGIYLMIFPNGMRYLGKSKHINKRIRQHFKDFFNAKDWHKDAYYTFTKKPKPERPPSHPDWKRITKNRQEIIDAEMEIFYRKRYEIAVDFFKNVQLYVWRVSVEDITTAENACLQRIVDRDSQDRYYNTVYPRQYRGDYDELLFT